MIRSLKLLGVAAAVLVPALSSTEASAQPYGPPPPPGYGSYNPWQWHQGLTFEGNLGFGFMWARDSSGDISQSDTQGALGYAIGLGGWLNPQVALSLRISGNVFSQDLGGGFSEVFSQTFVGPSIQFWLDPHLWLGGGVGAAVARVFTHDDIEGGSFDDNSQTGFGLDLRIGYSFAHPRNPNSWNISAEFTPGFYSSRDLAGGSVTQQLNGFAILFGYQFL